MVEGTLVDADVCAVRHLRYVRVDVASQFARRLHISLKPGNELRPLTLF